jgi:predicted transcriptional regulator
MRQRHALYLSAAMTERLEVMAETHRLSKSEILERALQTYLTKDADGRPTNLLARQQERKTGRSGAWSGTWQSQRSCWQPSCGTY